MTHYELIESANILNRFTKHFHKNRQTNSNKPNNTTIDSGTFEEYIKGNIQYFKNQIPVYTKYIKTLAQLAKYVTQYGNAKNMDNASVEATGNKILQSLDEVIDEWQTEFKRENDAEYNAHINNPPLKKYSDIIRKYERELKSLKATYDKFCDQFDKYVGVVDNGNNFYENDIVGKVRAKSIKAIDHIDPSWERDIIDKMLAAIN